MRSGSHRVQNQHSAGIGVPPLPPMTAQRFYRAQYQFYCSSPGGKRLAVSRAKWQNCFSDMKLALSHKRQKFVSIIAKERMRGERAKEVNRDRVQFPPQFEFYIIFNLVLSGLDAWNLATQTLPLEAQFFVMSHVPHSEITDAHETLV